MSLLGDLNKFAGPDDCGTVWLVDKSSLKCLGAQLLIRIWELQVRVLPWNSAVGHSGDFPDAVKISFMGKKERGRRFRTD